MTLKTKLIILAVLTAVCGVLLLSIRPEPSTGLRAAFDAEFLARPDGYPGLRDFYSLDFAATPLQLDPGLMYRALRDRTVDVINGYATDGRIPAYDLFILDDDKNFFPPYVAAPVIRSDTLAAYPELAVIITTLAGRLTDTKMQQLNYTVDNQGRSASQAAADFLRTEGLLHPDAVRYPSMTGTVAVGGKHFTEQEILAEMLAQIIEHRSGLTVRRFLNLGGTVICFNALRAGDIDIYVEYTGTALINILGRGLLSDPAHVYTTVRQAFAEQFDLIWLQPLGFNNTYTLTMRSDEAGRLGIRSISDLACFLDASLPDCSPLRHD